MFTYNYILKKNHGKLHCSSDYVCSFVYCFLLLTTLEKRFPERLLCHILKIALNLSHKILRQQPFAKITLINFYKPTKD